MVYKPLYETDSVVLRGDSGRSRVPLHLYEGPNSIIYWSTKPDLVYHPLNVTLSEFSSEHIDDMLARIIAVALKETVEPQRAGELNSDLKGQLLSYLGQS